MTPERRPVVEIRSRKNSQPGRMRCFLGNLWLAVWALWDGPTRLGEWGWRMAPRFGTFLDLLTGYTLPFLFAGIGGTVGGILGMVSAIGCAGEALMQLFISTPYKHPLSRVLVDWIPAG